MQTKRLTTYKQFVAAGYPYLPRLVDGRLLVSTIEINPTGEIKHKRRLVVSHTVVYNRCGLTAVYSEVLSMWGLRQRWLYWRDGQRVTWTKLTYAERWRITSAYWRALRAGSLSDVCLLPSRQVWHWRQSIGVQLCVNS
jgi:hypothetical protein